MLAFFPVLSVAGHGQTVKQVYAYPTSMPAPVSTPIQGRDGSLYTTASGDGITHGYGGVLRTPLTSKGTRLLHAFGGTDGENPLSGVILATDGNYYGVASSATGAGVFYKVSPAGTYTILHQFSGQSDGGYPLAPPLQASDGNLYGTTGVGNLDDGTVYKYSPASGTFTTIFSFNQDGSQGSQVGSVLVQASNGNLYGTAQLGGTSNCGTIFELSTSGSLLWEYSFPCGAGGRDPLNLMQASDGNFYGTTALGGNITTQIECKSGCGILYKLSNGVVSTLYSFSGNPNDGASPIALTQGTDGNLYGLTAAGGTQNLGTIYQISAGGQYKLLYSFVTEVGRSPGASLLQHTSGRFYGTTGLGGQNNQGSLFSLDMGLGPFIALVRYTGRIGQPVQILGQGLTGSTAVTINGIAATSFKVVTDRYMTAVVPTGATTGPVVVTTPKGTLTSNHNFRIVQ